MEFTSHYYQSDVNNTAVDLACFELIEGFIGDRLCYRKAKKAGHCNGFV